MSTSRVVLGSSEDAGERSLPASPMRTRNSSFKQREAAIPAELRDDKDMLQRVRQRGLLEEMIQAKREAFRDSIQRKDEKLFEPRVVEQYQMDAHSLMKQNIIKEQKKNKDKFNSLQTYTSRMEAYDQAFKQIKDRDASDDVDNLIRNLKMSGDLFNEKGKQLSEVSEQIAALEVKVDNARKEIVQGLVYSTKLNNQDKQAQQLLSNTAKEYDSTLARLAQYYSALTMNSKSIHRVVCEDLFFWTDSMIGQYGANKLLVGLGEDPASSQDLIRTKSVQELLGAMESLIHRLITYEYMSFGPGASGSQKQLAQSKKEVADDHQPDTDAEDGNGKVEESELNMFIAPESTHDITGPNQKIRSLISQIKVDDLDSVEIKTEHNYQRQNNKLLDLARLRQKNRDFFDEDTLVSLVGKKQASNSRSGIQTAENSLLGTPSLLTPAKKRILRQPTDGQYVRSQQKV